MAEDWTELDAATLVVACEREAADINDMAERAKRSARRWQLRPMPRRVRPYATERGQG